MSDLATSPRVIVVTDDTTLDDLAETIAILNAEAKSRSRRGKAFDDDDYATWHNRISAVVDEWLEKAHARA